MIAAKETDRESIGTLSGVTHQMGIAADATAHIMDILSKGLYSKPKAAIIREYSTNGRDAHVMAGTDHLPIEVTLPTDFKPVLSFRDYGTGLTEAEIGSIYSQYGASTKRASNEFNGMLGLGCKSAFSYTNQFTVVSIKDGVRIEVAVTRNDDGTGGMVVVDERKTDERSGTTVNIPTKRGDTFEDEAKAFYKAWEPGHVVVKRGSHTIEIDHFDKSAESNLDLGDGIFIVKHERDPYSYSYRSSDDRESHVVMGGVAYPMAIDVGLDARTHTLMVFAPMGAVNFAPSREELVYNSVTKAFIQQVEQTFRAALIRVVQAKIDAATSKAEAVKVVANWKALIPANVVPPGGYIYKGDPVPQNAQQDDSDQFALRKVPLERRGHHNSHSKTNSLSIESMVDVLFITDFNIENFTAAHAQKARKYVADEGLNVPNGFVFLGAIPAEIKPWLEHIVSYETIKAVKLPRTSAQRVAAGLSSRIPGSYDLFTTRDVGTARRTGVPADDFKTWSGALFYFNGNTREGRYYWDALRTHHTDATLVCMASSRIDKFVRSFPNATEAHAAVKAVYDAWAAKLGQDALLALAIKRDYTTRHYRDLDASKVDDPALSRYIRLSKQDTTKVENEIRTFQTTLGKTTATVDPHDFSVEYPLMETSSPEHTYFYVNAVYAARQNGATI